MPAGGVPATGYGIAPRAPTDPLSLFGNPASFTGAARTQGSDYDALMKGYREFLSRNENNPNPQLLNVSPQNITQQYEIRPQEVTAHITPYSESADVKGSLANLSNLATTGGLSEGDIANIRARDISPIRSIYSNAQRNVERQRALQGGYSPSFNATQARMAREESDIIGNKTTDVNAGIAEMVARGKLAAAPAYASAAGSEASRKAEVEQRNTDIINQINELNARNSLAAKESGASRALDISKFNAGNRMVADTGNIDRAMQDAESRRRGSLSALEGMRSLYGTTPALTNMFGNQVLQAGQLNQNQQQIDEQRRRNAMVRFG